LDILGGVVGAVICRWKLIAVQVRTNAMLTTACAPLHMSSAGQRYSKIGRVSLSAFL
jgi:hypothetical protein